MRIKNEALLVFYKEAMEELRERRRIEWQTFIVVNGVYLGLLKILQDLGSVSVFQAVLATIVISLFSYIWYIRIYGNAMRFAVLQKMRNDIQKCYKCDKIVGNAKNSMNLGWRRLQLEDDWILYGHRGICFVVVLYWIISIFGLWRFKVNYNRNIISKIEQFNHENWFKFGFIILIFIFIVVAIWLDINHYGKLKRRLDQKVSDKISK